MNQSTDTSNEQTQESDKAPVESYQQANGELPPLQTSAQQAQEQTSSELPPLETSAQQAQEQEQEKTVALVESDQQKQKPVGRPQPATPDQRGQRFAKTVLTRTPDQQKEDIARLSTHKLVAAPVTPMLWLQPEQEPGTVPTPDPHLLSQLPTSKLVAAPVTPMLWLQPEQAPDPAADPAPAPTITPTPPPIPKPRPRTRRLSSKRTWLVTGILCICVLLGIFYPLFAQSLSAHRQASTRAQVSPKPSPTPKPFDPNIGAILPTHRVVAFYAIPNAATTGPAYELTSSMLAKLQAQGNAYQKLDPAHPVQLGIDLVASIPDGSPGPQGTYSHHLDASTIQAYITYCQQHNLILFLDLDFGLASIKKEVNFFLPYLEKYSFVEMAVDPEWMFPRHNGIPGVNLSNVRASDLNPIIETLAALPMKYHVPRKILLIHQYRGDGDGLKDPYNPGVAEIADKRNLINDPRVDVVIHIDSVGGYVGDQKDKIWQYENWVGKDMQKYQNFRYGGFKLFYHIEKKTLMTPKQVLALTPPPMIVTYGN